MPMKQNPHPRPTAGFTYSAHPYMTPAERAIFERDRAAGRISFFRAEACHLEGCSVEVLKGKEFCSKAHYYAKKKADEDARQAEARAQLEQQALEPEPENEETEEMPEPETIEMELFVVDQVDAQGDIIPRQAALDMIKRFEEDRAFIPVTYNFDSTQPPIGRVAAMKLVDNRVVVQLALNDDATKLVDQGYEAALGCTGEPIQKEKHREITDAKLTEVALTKEKI